MTIKPGEVVWYVTGRFYVSADDSSIFDAGFFLHLQDARIDPRHLTFSAQPFQAKTMMNGDLKISIDPVGEFSIYYQQEQRAHYDDPTSFELGECVATFRRASIVAGIGVAAMISTNVFSSELIWSRPFEHEGVRIDLAELVPHGVTQWGTASPNAIASPPPGYSSVFPFAGSAIAVGAI